ncbi:tetratricopeptide repeat protein 5 [Latimeria chalumnae]|uniref:Tetratricopeptide repeat domain 5 n=1 Tax=Latimeria chalumnae TaxID=7897 RepID=H3AEX0_LATCH|nr:PREDICTED: tetratricopeptide repeat protein 5 [Latimeria chalumnae]|eukprot:XP_006007583.1 PREDICTED: tetratricopeptide repeat protein 5 [Latimeria chalumnae]
METREGPSGPEQETETPPNSNSLSLQELVQQLYHFRDHYFETHSVEDAGKKQQDVAAEMAKVVKQLEAMEDCAPSKACYLMLKGKALNVTVGYNPKAEEALARAVKLDPGLVEAWNQLGEVYWKKGDVMGAKTCFSGALNHCKNKVSLRNLSMVLRQIRVSGDDLSKNVFKSVKEAKEAVQMDIKDGTSWYILGNAYLSLFFITGQSPKISQQALSAYAQAEKVDPTASCNPDLHLNRATLFKYEENFQEAFVGFSRASVLDPAWSEPPLREQQLLDFLEKLTTLLSNKGKVKAKRLQNMLNSLRTSDLGPCGDGRYQNTTGQKVKLEPKPLSSLQAGVNVAAVVLGKVVFSLTMEEKVPFTFGLVDSEGSCYAVMVYNVAESWGVLIGDSVAIPEPNLKQQHVQHKGKSFSFSSIRVETPLLLVVNGKKQGPNNQAAAKLAYSQQSE